MHNPKTPQPKPRRRRLWLALAVVVLLLVAAGLLSVGYLLALQPVTLDGPGSTVTVKIETGQSPAQIAAQLHERGLLRHTWAFLLEARRTGQAGRLQAGFHELSTNMSTEEILAALATGSHTLRKVTLPEGLTLEQIADRLEAEGVCSGPDFIGAASDTVAAEVLGWELPEKAGTAEGYLFPDTYFFRRQEDPAVVVQAMLRQMKQQFIEPLWDPAARQRPWGGLHQVVTLASLVEREARKDDERALIAGVLVHRLRKNMRLQSCATVQYALPEHKSRLTYEDLKIDSPYNTYLYPGLPPGPICSPGLKSLEAALHPAATDYLFYVARPDGSHIFTRTYEQHLAAIRAIRGGG